MVLWTCVKYFKEQIPQYSREKKDKPHIITSNIEHDSIRLALKHLEESNVAGLHIQFSPTALYCGRSILPPAVYCRMWRQYTAGWTQNFVKMEVIL